jgi:hypothetical protein
MTSQRLREAFAVLDEERDRRSKLARTLLATPTLTGAILPPPSAESTKPKSAPASWRKAALEAVRQTALERDSFTLDAVGWPEGVAVDARARGAVLLAAAGRGWIERAGYADGGPSRHGRPIVQWRSRLTTKESI